MSAEKINSDKIALLGGNGLIPDYIISHYPNILHVTFGMGGSSKLGELGDVLSRLKDANIDTLCLIGSIERPSITSLWPSKATRALIKEYGFTMTGGDDALLKRLKVALIGEGFKIIGAQKLCPELLAGEGLLTQSTQSMIPDGDEVAHCLSLCKEYGRLDKGQSIIVVDGVMVASEDKEGTNALIKRNKARNAILVKASKPEQDLDLDLPTIGYETVVNAHDNHIKSIIVEAGRTLLVKRDKTIQFADAHHISIIGASLK